MPKIVDRDARRREIAHKAVEVFVRDGLQEANLGKVAALCGLGRTTIYQYFKNIDEVLGFTLEEVFRDLDREAREATKDESLDAVDKLLALLGIFEREAIEDRGRMILVLDFLLHPNRENPKAPVDVWQRVRDLRAGLEHILSEGLASGQLKPLNPHAMAFTLFSLVEAATVHAALYDHATLEDTVESTRLLVEGLRA